MEYFLEVNAKGSPEVSQKPVFGDPKITVPADGGEKRQPAAHKHLICPCGTLDQRSARAGQNTARDAPPPPRPAPRARGTARLRVSLPSPCGSRKSGGRAEGCQMELVKGMPLTFERWRLNFSQLDQDHEVLLTAAERSKCELFGLSAEPRVYGHPQEGILSQWFWKC